MKTLALAQHLGLEVFEFQGDYYTGLTQIEIDEMSITEAEQFCENEATLLEDYIVNSFGDMFEVDGNEYLVYTDSEADEAWDSYMDSYIDDCVLCELPEQYRQYFDYESFKKDCSYDGRGQSLAGYDGIENEVGLHTEDGTIVYYIYRTN